MISAIPVHIRSILPLSGLVVAICDGGGIDPKIIYPVCARLKWDDGEVDVWLYDQTQFPDLGLKQNLTLSGKTVAVSQGLIKALREADAETIEGTLELPLAGRFAVRPSRADDVPSGDVLQMSAQDAASLDVDSERHSRLLITTSEGIVGSLRVDIRSHVSLGEVRLSMLTRTLLRVPPGEQVMISDVRNMSRLVRSSRSRRHRLVRSIDRHFESILVYLFRAPQATLQATQTPPSDDAGLDVVRLDEAIFGYLGIGPGEQILLQWDGRRSAARALIAVPQVTAVEGGITVQGVDRRSNASAVLPPSLLVLVSAQVRRDLGLPVGAIVTVRRRVRTTLQGRLNQLTLPLLGLLLAGAAINHLSFLILGAGVALTCVLGLANLRIPRPPRGQF